MANTTTLPPATAKLFPNFSPFTIQTSTNPPIHIFGITSSTSPSSPPKPPLVLLHGYPQTHLIWHKLIPHVLPHYTLILPDLRGYGLSSAPASPSPTSHALYAKSALASDIANLMTALGHDTFFLLGHDRGGRVGHALCIKYPDRVRKAMFLDICPTLAMFTAADRALATSYWHWFFMIQPTPFPEDAMSAAPEAFARRQLTGMLKGRRCEDVFTDEAWEAYVALFRDWDRCHAMCEDYRAGAQEDCEEQRSDGEQGRRIRCKLRVLWGREGVVERLFDAKREWERVCERGCWDKGSEAVEGGHYIPEEQPQVLGRHCLEFFVDD